MNDISATNDTLDTPVAADGFDARLHSVMHAVDVPTDLQQRLLQIPDAAANDSSFLRRLLPTAAVLLLAIGMGLYYQPGAEAELAGEIFGHIYLEEPYFGDGKVLPLAEVNARMQLATGQQLEPEASAALEVTFAKDCYIAKQRTMHLVVTGETGPVNVMMIPAQVVEREVEIDDQRFAGLVTPASGGTLVVVGNKQEPIRAYRDLMATSLEWEY